MEQAVREAATIWPRPLQLELWPFGLKSVVRVMCDVGYLCANFILPRPHCSRLRPLYARDRRQTDIRRASSLNASAVWGRGHNKLHIHRPENKLPLGGGAGAYGVGALQAAQLDIHMIHLRQLISQKLLRKPINVQTVYWDVLLASTYMFFLYLYMYDQCSNTVQLCGRNVRANDYYTCALASGAVYCNRSCLCVCVFVTGGRGVSVTTITRNCVHRSSPNWVCRCR